MPNRFLCLSTYEKDGEEVWNRGKIYCALRDEGDTWSVETNAGGVLHIDDRFPINELEDIFLDLYYSKAAAERDNRLKEENKYLVCVYRDTIEAHGNKDNLADIEVSDKTLREYVAASGKDWSFEHYLNEGTASDNDALVAFLKERNEFVLPIECAIRQELVSMILETNKYAVPEKRLTLKEMNDFEHGWDDISLAQKIVWERLGRTFKAPDAVRSDLLHRLKLCFTGKFDELKKYKENLRKAQQDKASSRA